MWCDVHVRRWHTSGSHLRTFVGCAEESALRDGMRWNAMDVLRIGPCVCSAQPPERDTTAEAAFARGTSPGRRVHASVEMWWGGVPCQKRRATGLASRRAQAANVRRDRRRPSVEATRSPRKAWMEAACARRCKKAGPCESASGRQTASEAAAARLNGRRECQAPSGVEGGRRCAPARGGGGGVRRLVV